LRSGKRSRFGAAATAAACNHQEQEHATDHQQRHQRRIRENPREDVQDAFGFRLRFGSQVLGRLGDPFISQAFSRVRVAQLERLANPIGKSRHYLLAGWRRSRPQILEKEERQRQQQHHRRIVAEETFQHFEKRVPVHGFSFGCG
jgi:hypothetical protein